LEAAKQAGAVTINIGLFLNAVIGFLLVAIALFFVVRALNAARKKEDPVSTARPCPECTLSISTEARRCPYCTSKVTPLAKS
ncbi:MAG: MscL family protein, partial [Leptospiraceae bacterium]|nr:MscL family protein [Leptospiraceae bacterium]